MADSRTVFMTEKEYLDFHKDTLARVARENSVHIKIWKQTYPTSLLHAQDMWYGYCQGCNKRWQYWYFGATLGYGLEHIRREISRSL